MNMPDLIATTQEPIVTTQFKGYNHNSIIGDGEMFDMRNLSGKSFPLLDQRKKRGITSMDAEGNDPVPLRGIHGRDQLVFIRGGEVWYNQQIVGDENFTLSSVTPKKIVSMGAYVCIWPDKKYFNTADLNEFGSMDKHWSLETESDTDISMCMCRGDGTNYDYTDIITQPNEPEDPDNGQLWLDTSGATHQLMQYGSNGWTEVATTYVKISANGIGSGLKQYDCVNISGLVADSNNTAIQDQVDALNGSMILYQTGDNYIVVAGLLSQVTYVAANETVSIDLDVPDLDFVCESNNRLWGCKYGIENGNTVNEIRACKLGDFRNWQCFMGLSTDSYTASVGTDGPWTGCVTQKSYPVFFKEDCIHRVSGNIPANFTITTTMCRGVQQDSWGSAVVVNEVILYKSRTDIMVYDGSIPQSISAALGDIAYDNATAGAVDGKYYISMHSVAGWALFVYDTKTGLWYREDTFHALGFGTVQDELYAIDADNNTLVAMTGTNVLDMDEDGTSTIEGDLDWMAVFGLFGTDFTGNKYLSRFNLRMQMEPGSTVHLYIQYDQDGEWHDEGEIRGLSTKSFVIPVVPRRCDHLQFKLEGHGTCRIYSMSRMLEVGGDG